MSRTIEERIASLEKTVKNQQALAAAQTVQIDKLWSTLARLANRTDQLKTAVPHVQFKDW